MGVSPGKTKFAQDIYDETDASLRKLKEALTGTYADIIKAIVDAFTALPGGIQENLMSKNPVTRDAVIEALGRLTPQPATETPPAPSLDEKRIRLLVKEELRLATEEYDKDHREFQSAQQTKQARRKTKQKDPA